MANTDFVPSRTTRTDVQIGLTVADQRTGDRRQVIYADSRIVLVRDEADATTLIPRRTFETELGTRYHVRPNAAPSIDGGQYERLRARLAEYDEQDGRKAHHKADALREALDLLADTGTDTKAEETKSDDDQEVAFEEIPGIGPKTASRLRGLGIVTVTDVDGATDDVLRSIPGVGPDALEKIRALVEERR
ncbi:helix-hairpin-helix domain-containing protein [Halalkalicoccus subterraneus]|uniref:helix-hairpin-helix domain-containing protein n=1 Tax=Halalkalicoccus subterraneus TaxID=2675002 RepID=UPI000EFD7773|nr:helix-hairpin-helix domain-containing protein [Halalkalicoccus subterraneus]